MRIDIYIDTETHGLYKKDRGATWYLMESTYKDKPITKRDRITWIDQNRNGAALEGILFALRQVRAKDSDIFVHVNNPYVCGYAQFRKEWEHRNYLTGKGFPVKYRDLWKSLNEIAETRKNRIYFSRDVPGEKNIKNDI